MKRIITLLLLLITAISFKTQAQTGTVCNAEFSFQYLSANTVKFTPAMPGDSPYVKHDWNFGDASPITHTKAPTHAYTASGTYFVTHYLTRYNPNGVFVCSDTVTKQIIIQQTTACNLQANFIFHTDSTTFSTVLFSNTSLVAAATDSVRWTFGDGTSVNGLQSNLAIANPLHTYANAGTYSVCLRIKRNNSAGTAPCVSEICKTVAIAAPPCNLQAYFVAQPDTAHPLRIKFTNQSAPIIAADSVTWTFGDGTSVSGLQGDPNVANPTHNYAQAGSYTVCIRVKKALNASGTAPCVKEFCKTVVVQSPCNFQVNFAMHRDTANPRKVYFTNLTLITTTNATAKWSFGDGTYAGTWNAIHEYTQPGTYIVCLTVQTEPNCVKQLCDTIIIAPVSPACSELSKFKFEKFTTDNQKYKFTPDFISNDIQYTWTFGDGTGSHDAVATHRYAQPGIYIACLTAWRGSNCASTTCKEIRVLPQINCDSIRVSFNWQKDPFMANKIYFYANANFPLIDQTWTITKLTPVSASPVILHQNNPAYVFADSGTYRVCLKAITLGGCVKEYCAAIRIENNAPVCLLQAYPNPATTVINVAVQLQQPEMIHTYIYNSLNILVRDKNQQGVAGANTVTINVATLPAGLYTVKAVYGNKICYARFTKQ